MKKLPFFTFWLLMLIFATISLRASEQPRHLNSTDRAKLAWIRENQPPDSTESELINRLKWRKVLRITRNYGRAAHGISTYERIQNLNLGSQADQYIFDSLLNGFLTEMDLRYNPDTPENEFEIEMLKRMKYCDDYRFGKWWISSDLRADIILQQGLDWLIYVPPYEAACSSLPGRFRSQVCCYHCQLSYPNRGIFLQLEGKTSECFNKIAIWDDNDCMGGFPPSDEEKWNKLFRAQEIFREEIAERETPPAYKPFKSQKNLKMALRIIKRPLGNGTYEIWSLLASPLDQFDRDSINKANFGIDQVVWSMDGMPEIFDHDSLGKISVEINGMNKDGFYFSAIKSILHPGKWKFVLTPVEYSKDSSKTIFSIDLEIPADSGKSDLSDIMLYLDEDNGKVAVGGRHYVGLPFSAYKNEHTLNAMISSCKSPQKGTSLVAWYLRPIKEKQYILRGKPKAEEDSVRWVDWPEDSLAFGAAIFPVRKFLEKDDIVLVCQEIPNRQIFELNQPLAKIPHGDYELRFLIMDPHLKDNKVRESSTLITVK